MVLHGDLRLFHLAHNCLIKQTVQTLIRRRVCKYPSTKPSPVFRIELSSEATGCEFHIVNIRLVRLTYGLIALVSGNHVNNNIWKF